MRPRLLIASGLAAMCLTAVTGCGSTSSGGAVGPTPLSSAAYSQALHQVAMAETHAQHRAAEAFHAKKVRTLRRGLTVFAADQTGVAAQLSGLRPPPDAVDANAALAQAFMDSASAIRDLLPRIVHAKSVKHAFVVIQADAAGKRAGEEIDAAIKQLEALGYTSGS